jgi:hypothetical protein
MGSANPKKLWESGDILSLKVGRNDFPKFEKRHFFIGWNSNRHSLTN